MYVVMMTQLEGR